MSQETYISELEQLVREVLLPVYYAYHAEHNTVPLRIDPKLLKQVEYKSTWPRLFLPPSKPQ